MPATRVVNVKRVGYRGCLYIGRGSAWGNPFKIGSDGTREEVIEKYRVWLRTSNEPIPSALRKNVALLRGRDLGCFCAPQPCHGDVLKELADKA